MHPCLTTSADFYGHEQLSVLRRLRLYETFLLLFLVSAILFSPLQQAHAENHDVWTEAAFQAKAYVTPSCFLYQSGTLSFPDLDPSMGDVSAVNAFKMSCTLGSNWRITMDMGRWQAGGSRRMKHESRDIYIPYNLSVDQASGAGAGTHFYEDRNVRGDLYSRDFSGAAPGNYSDTVIVTLTPSVGN